MIKAHLHEGSHASFRVSGLPPDKFVVYREAMDGSRFMPALGISLASIDKVPPILVRLRKIGLAVDLDPDLRRALQGRQTQEWMDREGLKERFARADDELFNRTGDRLFKYQWTGALWLAGRTGGLLADEMGLGKTAVTIMAIPPGAPFLVVAPAAAKGVWSGQLRRWRPGLASRTEILSGRDSFRWPARGRGLITNWDILPDFHDTEGKWGRACDGELPPEPCKGCAKGVVVRAGGAGGKTRHLPDCTGFTPRRRCSGCHPMLKQCPEGLVVIGDEAQAIKNADTLRARRFDALAWRARSRGGRTWLLSGTPLENEPLELWNVLSAAGIAQEAFGNRDKFCELFNGRKLSPKRYKWGLPKPEVKDHLQRVMLRRLRRDVLPDLPGKVRGSVEVEVDRKTIAQIEEFLAECGKTVEQIAELVEQEEMKLESMSSIRAALATAKIPAMMEIASDYEEKGEPLVVFSAHRRPIEALAARGWLVITGTETATEKTRAADQFQHGYYASADATRSRMVEGARRRVDVKGEIMYPPGIGITIAAGGTALTLTRASHELFVDRAWKPTANLQAEDRCVRIGTKKSVLVTTLYANHPLDERVTEVLVKKIRLISASVDAAADSTDAPAEKALEVALKEQRAALAAGRVGRREPTDTEKQAIAILTAPTTKLGARRERLVADLLQEAEVVGLKLSEAQWSLVCKMASEAVRPMAPPKTLGERREGGVKPGTEARARYAARLRRKEASEKERER